MPRFIGDLGGTRQASFRVRQALFDAADLTASRTFTLPDQAGTVALLGDVAGYASARTIAAGTTTDTPTNADTNRLIRCQNTGALVITLTSSGMTQYKSGGDVIREAAGAVTFVADTGMTLIPATPGAMRAIGSGASWVYMGSNTFWVLGDFDGASGGASDQYAAITNVSGTSYAPASADAGTLLSSSNAGTTTISLDKDSFTAGEWVDVLRTSGPVVITATDGTIIGGGQLTLSRIGAGASIVYLGSSNFWVVGDTSEGMPGGLGGLKLACIGDSITGLQDYPQRVGAKTGMAASNYGLFGLRMSELVGDSYNALTMGNLATAIASGTFTTQISAANLLFTNSGGTIDLRGIITAMDAEDWTTVKHAVIMFGTNDYANNVPIGAPSDTALTTFKGAINSAISTILTAHPTMNVYFLTPTYNDTVGNTANTTGARFRDYADAVLERAAANNMPAFDMMRNGGVNAINEGTYTTDGVHPTAAGAERMADKVSGFLMGRHSDASRYDQRAEFARHMIWSL